ncbi:MAG: WXG100 family type VII secretion target [Actinomycetota bacterium]|nr:WXG100 family type VII secretion target [Actinomycetota bacterium]
MSEEKQAYDEAIAEASHGDVAGVIAGIESSLADLTGFVNSVKSQWEGSEQEQYTGIQQRWDSSSKAVQEILTQIATALGANTSSVKEMRGKVMSAIAAG